MTGYELLEMLICFHNGDVDNIIESGASLLDSMNEKGLTKLSIDFEKELEIYALSENRCYLCNSDLEVNSHYENREYQGQVVKEKIHRTECCNYNCSYVVG